MKTQRFTAFTQPLPLKQGEVTNSFHRLRIPEGPIAVYRFEADVVEQLADGTIVPTPIYDAYLHHHVVGSNHAHYNDRSNTWTPMKPVNFSRSVGFGAGTECRGTPQTFPYPYAFMTVDGEDEWIANVHIINTRNMTPQHAHQCLECPCTSEDELTPTQVNGMEFTPDACNAELRAANNTACSALTYYGGLRCCEDGEFCLEKEQVDPTQPASSFLLRYSIEYAPPEAANRPLYLASCCDASGDLLHHGNVEYDVPLCDPAIHPGCVHTLSTRQRIDGGAGSLFDFYHQQSTAQVDREIELVYAVGHQHRGGMGIHLFDDSTGELLCSSVPQYGAGTAIGDEKDYVVAMSTCTFDPPKRMRASDIVRIAALYNNSVAHTGVMSLMYLAIADVLTPMTMQEHAVQTTQSYDYWMLLPVLAAVVVVGMLVLKQVKARRGYTSLSASSSSL